MREPGNQKIFLEPSLVMSRSYLDALQEEISVFEECDFYFPEEFYEVLKEFNHYQNIPALRFYKGQANTAHVPPFQEILEFLDKADVELYSIEDDELPADWEEIEDELKASLSFYQSEDRFEELEQIMFTEIYFIFNESFFLARNEKAINKFKEVGFSSFRVGKKHIRENHGQSLRALKQIYEMCDYISFPANIFFGMGVKAGKIAIEEETDISRDAQTIFAETGKTSIRTIVYADP